MRCKIVTHRSDLHTARRPSRSSRSSEELRLAGSRRVPASLGASLGGVQSSTPTVRLRSGARPPPRRG